MKNLNKLITIIFLAVLCACNSDDDNNPNDNNNYFEFEFLKVGNKWEYAECMQTDDCFSNDFGYTEEITGITNYNDDWYYPNQVNQIDYDVERNTGDNTAWAFIGDTVLFTHFWWNTWSSKPFSYITGGFIFKDEKLGNKILPISIDAIDTYLHRNVVSLNETVTVPAGTFHNCIKIKSNFEYNNQHFEGIYFFSYKYGTIKFIYKEPNKDEKTIHLMRKNF